MSNLSKTEIFHVWNCPKSIILDLRYFETCHFQEIWFKLFSGNIQMWSKFHFEFWTKLTYETGRVVMGIWGIFWQSVGSVTWTGLGFHGFCQMCGNHVCRTTKLTSIAFLSTLFGVLFIGDRITFRVAPSFAISAFDDHFSVFVPIWKKLKKICKIFDNCVRNKLGIWLEIGCKCYQIVLQNQI